MDDNQVDDIPLAPRRRSYRLLDHNHAHAVRKNKTEDEDVENDKDVVDQPKNRKQVCKRHPDNSAAGDGVQDETAVDCSSQPKKTKKADEVKVQKDAMKAGGLERVTPAMPSAIPSSSSSSPENLLENLITCEIEQMQHVRSVMKELKNVPDITEMIKDNDTNKMPGNSNCSSSSAPAMVSEGMGGRFQTVNFYWLDMFEEPEYPGVLFIFGKVKSPSPGNGYSSGCILVKNLNRRVFLLPRETKADGTPVDYMDVYNEFYTIFAPKFKLSWFQSKRSKRKYCFDIQGIPPEAEYTEVRYSGTAPVLPQDLQGETFSHAFGTNTSLMETFLLEKKFKGPSWLQLSYCERVEPDQQQSWAKFEFTCDVSSVQIHPDTSKFPVPTLVLASLQTETVYDSDLKRPTFILAGVAVVGNSNVQLPSPPNEFCNDYFCLINTPRGHTWPSGLERITNKRILKMDSESTMLACLVKKLHEIDADVYLDYDTDLNRLLNQLSDLKVPNWSRIGRLKRSTTGRTTEGNLHLAIRGRLFCGRTIRGMLRVIGSQLALRGKEPVASSLASSEKRAVYKSSQDLKSFVKWAMKHCLLKIRDMNEVQALPVAFQTSCIVGGTLTQMLTVPFAQRSEFLMLHAISAKGYLVPDDCQSLAKIIHNDAAASHQMVLELGSGKTFYENYVLQLRLNSHMLYAYALQEFQMALTNDADAGTAEPIRSTLNELWKMGESRKQVESLMEMTDVTADQMRQYMARLEALKRAMFDVVFDSCEDWRFSSKTLKAYMKARVRAMLLNLKEIVRKMGYEVIYGDECSVMIQTHSLDVRKALEIETQVEEEIRRTYPLLWCCSFVRIYRCLLLLKDNRHTGLLYTPNKKSKFEVDLKHFSVDPCGEMPTVVSKTARACLLEILSEQPLRDKKYKVGKILRDVGSQLRDGALPFEELLISKTLTKNPEEYENSHGLHHVTVALQMNKSETLEKKLRKGDQVSYVLCKDGRPRHLSEMKSKKDEETNMQADPDYYLAKMIYPVLTEICERIPGLGLDSAGVANVMGLGDYAGLSSLDQA